MKYENITNVKSNKTKLQAVSMHWAELNPGVRLYHLIMVTTYQILSWYQPIKRQIFKSLFSWSYHGNLSNVKNLNLFLQITKMDS